MCLWSGHQWNPETISGFRTSSRTHRYRNGMVILNCISLEDNCCVIEHLWCAWYTPVPALRQTGVKRYLTLKRRGRWDDCLVRRWRRWGQISSSPMKRCSCVCGVRVCVCLCGDGGGLVWWGVFLANFPFLRRDSEFCLAFNDILYEQTILWGSMTSSANYRE